MLRDSSGGGGGISLKKRFNKSSSVGVRSEAGEA